jgi:hypothetical protein
MPKFLAVAGTGNISATQQGKTTINDLMVLLAFSLVPAKY